MNRSGARLLGDWQAGKKFVFSVLVAAITLMAMARTASADGFGPEAWWGDGFCGTSDLCAVANVDGVGGDDAVSFRANGDVYVALSSGDRFNTPALWLSGSAPPSAHPRLGDFNGDGKADIVTFTTDVKVALSTGSSFATATQWRNISVDPGSEYINVVVGDFDATGSDDVAFWADDGIVAVLTWNTSTSSPAFNQADWANGNFSFFYDYWMVYRAADVNNDGKVDIIKFANDSSGDVWVALSNGQDLFVAQSTKWHDDFATGGHLPAVGDVDGDGIGDILSFEKQSSTSVWLALAGSGSFGSKTLEHDAFCGDAEQCLVGDVNGDGKADLIAFVLADAGAKRGGSAYVSVRQTCGVFTTTGTSCSDGLWCNGPETCHAGGYCYADTNPADDGNACTVDLCDEGTQQVSHSPVDPDDANPCTTDFCDSATGVRNIPLPIGSSCSDGNACNGIEVCDDRASCSAVQTPSFDDGNPCTADACDSQTGAVTHTPQTGTSCSDGNACNGGEICASGVCVGDPSDPPPAPPQGWEAQCSECTPDVRTGEPTWAAKTSAACDDGNVCTTGDSCTSQATCAGGAALANGTSCSDGNVCNGPETCQSGACAAGTSPTLNDGNDCTLDTCDSQSGTINPPVAKGTTCSEGECDGAGRCLTSSEPLPPEPQPSAIDRTVATNFSTGVAFLHEGTNAVQIGVSSGVLAPQRVGVVRGRLMGRDQFGGPGSEKPLPNVKVTVVGESTLGYTMTRLDGVFDLAVNGGGTVALRFEKQGYLTAWRQVTVPWNDFALLEDVVLVEPDTTATNVDVCGGSGDSTCPTVMTHVSGAQVVEAKPGGGTFERQGVLLFPSELQATITPDQGQPYVAHDIDVRIVEYTVGPRGPASMPSDLPPTTGYTYAVELEVAGAKTVSFDKPVIFYVDNFLAVQPGQPVPSGYFDVDQLSWKASETGRVVQLVSVTSGSVDIDVDGDGNADAQSYSQLGITSEERQKLAELFPPSGGSYSSPVQLWRAAFTHFTPTDLNYGLRTPSCNEGGPCDDDNRGKVALAKPESRYCPGNGSIIECDNQVLGERLEIAGSPLTLNYRSSRNAGYFGDTSIKVRLPDTPKTQLIRYEVELRVAGRVLAKQAYPAALSGGTLTVVWDGTDVYGRPLQGIHEAALIIDEFYPAIPTPTQAFSNPGGLALITNERRTEFRRRREVRQMLGRYDASALELGGWTLSAYHVYDPKGRVLFLGNGDRVEGAAAASDITRKFAGTGAGGNASDGSATPVATTPVGSPKGVAVAPDGSVFVSAGQVVRKIFLDVSTGVWKVQTYAGRLDGEGGFDGDGAAPGVRLANPEGLAVGADGSLYVADSGNHRIRRIKNGGITTVAGGGNPGTGVGDGGPATQAELSYPKSVAVAADGTLFIADTGHKRVRRVDPNGTISTYGSTGSGEFWACPFVNNPGTANAAWSDTSGHPYGQTLATDVPLIPESVALESDGSLLVGHYYGGLFRIGVDGIVRLAAGNCGGSTDPNDAFGVTLGGTVRSLAVAPGNVIYFGEAGAYRVRRISSDGKIATVAGTGSSGTITFDTLATQTPLDYWSGLAVAPDKSIYMTVDNHHYVARIEPLDADVTPQGDLAVVSEDGSLRYEFLSSGRHVRTRNALTNALLLNFDHDSTGLLTKIVEHHPGAPSATPTETTIARGSGWATITGPHGHETRLTLNSGGYLTQLQTPVDALTVAQAQVVATTSMAVTSGGLLTSLTDARGYTTTFGYDIDGRLVSDEDPLGGDQVLEHTLPATWQGKVVTRSSPMGRVRTYAREAMPDGSYVRTVTHPDQTSSVSVLSPNNTRTTTAPDGTVTVQVEAPDPVFGAPFMYAKSATMTSPLGLGLTVTRQRPAPPETGLTFAWSEQTSIPGGDARTGYVAATKTLMTKSFAGRTTETVFDDAGRIVEARIPGLLPLQVNYDPIGRPVSTQRGSGASARIHTFGYHTAANHQKGYLAWHQDPLGTSSSFVTDALGRVTSQTRLSATTGMTWDLVGNLTSLTPPGRPAHSYTFNALNLGTSYQPPTSFSGAKDSWQTWNPDRAPVSSLEPSGASSTWYYDGAGRPSILATSSGNVYVTYYPATPCSPSAGCAPGAVATVTGPGSQGLEMRWDGALLKSEINSGVTAGTVSWTYDNQFQVVYQAVNVGTASSQVARSYDLDGLLRCTSHATCPSTPASPVPANQVWLAYDSANGLLNTVTMGLAVETLAYNSFGDMASQEAKWDTTTVFDVQYDPTGMPRDVAGRIRRKAETLGSTSTVWDYVYDGYGRVKDVTRDGPLVESYTYDLNGNRLTALGMTGTATYDDQDRLLTYPRSSSEQYLFEYTPDGYLKEKRNTVNNAITTYTYDIFGNLRTVALPSSAVVTYDVDALGRRIRKNINGTPVRSWLYDGSRIVAELDANGALARRFVYGSRHQVPDYVIDGSTVHRILVDQLGSPRMAIDTTTGAVTMKTTYDTFGNIFSEWYDSFERLPFGFAGGHYDPDTQLTRFGARDYDPVVGRWISKDPAGLAGGINLYNYSGGDPVNFVDVDGRMPWIAVGILVGAALYASADAPLPADQIPGAEAQAALGGAIITISMGIGLVPRILAMLPAAGPAATKCGAATVDAPKLLPAFAETTRNAVLASTRLPKGATMRGASLLQKRVADGTIVGVNPTQANAERIVADVLGNPLRTQATERFGQMDVVGRSFGQEIAIRINTQSGNLIGFRRVDF